MSREATPGNLGCPGVTGGDTGQPGCPGVTGDMLIFDHEILTFRGRGWVQNDRTDGAHLSFFFDTRVSF